MSAVEKQYGLIDPKTSKKLSVSDVFNNDSDSDGGQDSKWSVKSIQRQEKGVKKQTKLEMQRALQQDPTVYQYDEIYDEMTQKKQEAEQTKVNPEKKPKYIQNLMKIAERRKKENERRLERQIQKEREAEGDMFKDKEEFITSSYKAKLEEFKKADEEERKMEYIESVMDVTKQQDLGGFYRHLYKETVPDQNPGETVQPEEKEECGVVDGEKPEEKSAEPAKNERHYRKRHNSDSNDGEEKKTKQDSSSSSSDSDSSSDSSSTSSSSEEEKNEAKESEQKQNDPKSGPEDGEIVERSEKNKKEDEKAKGLPKNGKADVKTDPKEEKSRSISKNSKPEERDRRDRSYRTSGYDRDRNRSQRRDDRGYRERDRDRDRERERERERERDRERRDDRKMRDRAERRSSDSRRRRSKTPERRRNKSRERSCERSRSRRGQDKCRDTKDVKSSNVSSNSNNNSNNIINNEDEKRRELKEVKKEVVKEVEEKKPTGVEEEAKVSIWEKRTVGAVFEAALERYRQRKAARGL